MTDKRIEIRQIIRDTRSLPAIPGIINKLNSLSDNRRASIKEMAEVVSSDPVLSAKVLRLANSPSYGFPRISTVSNAMILLGVDVVKSLVITSSIFEIMEKNVIGLWEHSLGAAAAANIIARRLQMRDCEEIATAALLHDIGKVIIKMQCDDDYPQLVERLDHDEKWMKDAERELLGTDHAEVGGWLAESWFLPEKLAEPIRCHHDVGGSVVHTARTAVVHLADIMIKASGFGFTGDEFVPPIHEQVVKRLGITREMLADIAGELEERLFDVRNFTTEIQRQHG